MKLFKTTLTVLALTAILSVQTFSQSSFGLGLEGGLNLSNISTTPDLQMNSRTAMVFGTFADIGVSNIISIKPGVRFTMKGFSTTSNGITETYRLNYIELPLMLKVSLPLPKVRPYFEAGPTVAFMLSANGELTDGVNVLDQDVSQLFESIDAGIYFGGGLGFKVAAGTELFTSFGYSLGLTDVAKSQGLTGKNNGFRFLSGIRFGL